MTELFGIIPFIHRQHLEAFTWSAPFARTDVEGIQPREDLGALVPISRCRPRGQRHASGFNALTNNSRGYNNTASGFNALVRNTDGSDNTASGAEALSHNTTGIYNTASGVGALRENTVGIYNTASGVGALSNNTTGYGNTASGAEALSSNTDGIYNTASGRYALFGNTTGDSNTAIGVGALQRNTGDGNTASGAEALQRNTGDGNTAIGAGAGLDLDSGSRNIYLGSPGVPTESDTMRLGESQTRTFIAGIAGTPLSGSAVVIDAAGQLGILASSARYKRDVHDLGEHSRGVVQLRPVTFRYTQDPQGVLQYGLIAEEVAAVYPELVVRGPDGTVEAVQYHGLIPLLLNELQHQQQELTGQARQLTAQSQQLAELKAQHESLQVALVQQNAELAARLARLEEGAARTAPSASR